MNANAIQEFLFRHFEKFVFAMLVLLAVFLVYQGLQKPDILAVHQPDKMEQQANQVKTSIDDDHWAAIKDLRIPTFDIVAKTQETVKPVDSTVYRLPHPWEAKSIDSSMKRTDPTIPIPLDLRVKGVVASLAWKSMEPYALKLLEPADPAVKVEQPKQRPSRRDRRAEMMMMMEGGMDPSMMEGDYGMDYGMDPSMMDPSMMGMDPSMGMAPIKPIRKVNATLYDQGFRPTGMGGDTAPVLGHFIAGVALMPQKKIVEEFEKALMQADGYNPQRDMPYFIGFQLQRADVTNKSVDQLTDADWGSRGDSRYFQRLLLYRWAGMAKEIVAAKYRDAELTSAIPPVLLDHYAWFTTHPRIPVGDEPLPGTLGPQLPLQTEPAGPIIPGELDSFGAKGRAGVGMMDPGYDMGMDYSSVMNPYGTGMKIDHPEFKLIRFYDFRDFQGIDPGAPRPGRKYVYRIRVALEDPNFPSSPVLQPRNGALAAEVFRRVEKLNAKYAEVSKGNVSVPRPSSLWTIWSDFSEPSEPVSLPDLTQAFAGPVTPPTTKVYQLDPNTQIEFQSKPPRGKLVVSLWDATYAAPVPIFTEVGRGTVVAKDKAVIEIPDPVSLDIRKTPEATINTSNVVLDIVGGKPLGIVPADNRTIENQTEPGVFLLFDANGGLEVADEIESQRSYRLYSFADERGE